MSTRHTQEVGIIHGRSKMLGDLTLPPHPSGIVIFAHGSGSSRHSPRNKHVARILEHAGMGTLLLDLLTSGEEYVDEASKHFRFNIGLLAERIVTATDWVTAQPTTKGLPIGYFGASTGAAGAMVAATHRSKLIQAIVSRGGRPDLAGVSLASVWTPTLLIVGGLDETVLAVNREAGRMLPGPHDLKVIPGATHLFEEPGAIDDVAHHAANWFCRYLNAHPTDELGEEWDREEQSYEHILEGTIARGEDRNG